MAHGVAARHKLAYGSPATFCGICVGLRRRGTRLRPISAAASCAATALGNDFSGSPVIFAASAMRLRLVDRLLRLRHLPAAPRWALQLLEFN